MEGRYGLLSSTCAPDSEKDESCWFLVPARVGGRVWNPGPDFGSFDPPDGLTGDVTELGVVGDNGVCGVENCVTSDGEGFLFSSPAAAATGKSLTLTLRRLTLASRAGSSTAAAITSTSVLFSIGNGTGAGT